MFVDVRFTDVDLQLVQQCWVVHDGGGIEMRVRYKVCLDTRSGCVGGGGGEEKEGKKERK